MEGKKPPIALKAKKTEQDFKHGNIERALTQFKTKALTLPLGHV
jgi:hypothetical protein